MLSIRENRTDKFCDFILTVLKQSIFLVFNVVQHLRTTLYQSHKREIAAVLQPSHVRS